ncbi:hypothetical protein L3Q72_06280 [Vibrio sp. JC009]|uniref:hypothetical protein n=1 Tax=Vibrio sp. JC009 TaxID=2912314 RepID=UPI0023AE8ECF|nr:hypothetical protein [Vibrio sp. JC009]WED22999.1 hypothetical protein L3Q72_06280 [Vibrio sp. JC009]
MKRILTTLLLSMTATFAHSADNQCLSGKYDAYIDASLTWYQDLIELTSSQYPELAEVGDWFYQQRKNHFELNRAAVHYYLEKDMTKVATEQPIEAWLQLEQKDVKQLAGRNDSLGELANKSFQDRQHKRHPQNYELRSAFAELLSHPDKIDVILTKYNTAMEKAEQLSCD